MASLESCFFCCEYISPENKNVEEGEIFQEPVNIFNGDNYTSNATIKENVLRISHYLKVPRTLIDQNKGEVTSVIKTCQACTEISKNLSDCCVQLEIVKMKISHYFNQLTNQITGINKENFEKSGVDLTNFQKNVHQKCLLEVLKAEKSSYPQIHLNNCTSPPQAPVINFKVEENTDYPETLEEVQLGQQLKMEDDPALSTLSTNDVFSEELDSCPFCTFVVNGPYEELHSHISTDHPEQIETDQDSTSFEPTDNSDDHQNGKYSKLIRKADSNQVKCNKCGKFFSDRGTLKRHLKTSANCGQNGGKKTGNFMCSNCERRYSRKDYLKYHIKNVCQTGFLVDLENGKQVISLSNSCRKQKREKKMSKCEFCGKLVDQINLEMHVNLKHGNESENCRVGESLEEIAVNCQVKDPVLIVRAPYSSDDRNMVIDGAELNIEDDPLKM